MNHFVLQKWFITSNPTLLQLNPFYLGILGLQWHEFQSIEFFVGYILFLPCAAIKIIISNVSFCCIWLWHWNDNVAMMIKQSLSIMDWGVHLWLFFKHFWATPLILSLICFPLKIILDEWLCPEVIFLVCEVNNGLGLSIACDDCESLSLMHVTGSKWTMYKTGVKVK